MNRARCRENLSDFSDILWKCPVCSICERACGERILKPPLSNKGGTKNKKQYTLTSGKRCIYKAKPHFTWRDINYAIITLKS